MRFAPCWFSIMKYFKLLDRIVIRSIREDKFLTVLSILGVALGIGLFMGVNVATNRAVKSFEENITGLNPAFNYEVAGRAGTGFDEAVYRTVHVIAEKSLPLLTSDAFIPAVKRNVDITGVYTVKALTIFGPAEANGKRRPFVQHLLEDQETRIKGDIERFMTTPNGVLITKKFSDEHGLKKGQTLVAYVYSKEYLLEIVGIIDVPSLSSNTLFMDLGNYQEFFGKTGSLSRIDLAADDKTAEAIGRILPPDVAIEKKQNIMRNQKGLIDAFRFNLRFVTFLAVLVGVFLLYNTIFISVVKRRTEIGTLRGLGMDRKTVVLLFSCQGIILGFFGSVLGIVFGQVFSWFSIVMVEKTMTRFYGGPAVSDYFITWTDAFATLGLGLVVSLLASLVPAFDSAAVRPNESWREGSLEKTYKGRQRMYSIIGGFSILAAAGLAVIDYRFVPFDFPWLSYAAIILFIMGCTMNSPLYLGGSLRVLKRPLYRVFKASARIALGDTGGSRYRFSLALMSVAVSSALIVAIVTSVFSLKSSFIDWIHRYINADIYIQSASCPSNFCFYPLPEEVIDKVKSLPGVERLGMYRAVQVDFQGRKIVAGFGDSDLLWKYQPNLSRDEKERLQRLAQYREVAISDYLKIKYGLKRGDVLELETPKGRARFTINSSSISYSTLSGFIYMDHRWLKEYWGLDDATQLSLYLSKNADKNNIIRTIEQGLGRKYALDVSDNKELRTTVLTIFDRSFALTYTIEVIAIIISIIGVVNALLILVFEKKHSISILRYLGATWKHISQSMVLAASIIGIAGIALGCVMGTAISMVITHVINRISFGWEVSLRIPFMPLLFLMALLFITTMAAGLAPSYLARKIDPKAYISFE